MQSNEKPEAIILTIPLKFFEEYKGGEKRFKRNFEILNQTDGMVWNNTIAAVPVIDVLYCYICYNGYIRYRANIAGYEKGSTKTFSNGGGNYRTVKGKNWIILTAPIISAPRDIEQKGFQGFRYSEVLF